MLGHYLLVLSCQDQETLALPSPEMRPIRSQNQNSAFRNLVGFPNPNTGEFYIQVNFTESKNATVRLSNVLGQILKEYHYSESEFNVPVDVQHHDVACAFNAVIPRYQGQKLLNTRWSLDVSILSVGPPLVI